MATDAIYAFTAPCRLKSFENTLDTALLPHALTCGQCELRSLLTDNTRTYPPGAFQRASQSKSWQCTSPGAMLSAAAPASVAPPAGQTRPQLQ